jgi:regulator of replication initiation timing
MREDANGDWQSNKKVIFKHLQDIQAEVEEIKADVKILREQVSLIQRECPLHRLETSTLRELLKESVLEEQRKHAKDIEALKKFRIQIITALAIIQMAWPFIYEYISFLIKGK